MEQGIRISPKSSLRSNNSEIKKEVGLKITKAFYLGSYTILLEFSNGVQKRLDFLPIFNEFVKGEYLLFFEPEQFKKFVTADGNISWGTNEDIIFPQPFLYNHIKAKKEKEEVLFVL